jgi:hypothetical protein
MRSARSASASDVLSVAPGFGELKAEQVKCLKDLELENSWLGKAVSDLTLDKLILQEANFSALRVAVPALSTCERSCMSPSVAPVRRRSGSIARHNARFRAVVRTSSVSPFIELARQYGRYGYRKVAELLCQAGWTINDTGRADLATWGAQGSP